MKFKIVVSSFVRLFEYFVNIFDCSFMVDIKSVLNALNKLIEIDLSIFILVLVIKLYKIL